MLKKYNATLMFALTIAISQPAQAANNPGYWGDSSSATVSTGFGKCWRTIDWNSSLAIPGCEGGKMVEADSDMDGVVDSKDNCPSTMAGIMVDANGCAKDSDNDGILDSSDKCPGTLAGVMVDAKGCAKDSDNDGVIDSNDQCPDTMTGIKVNSKGCPKDSDNDGVADSYDKCPGTATGAQVDATGCDVNRDDDNDGIVNNKDKCPGTVAGTVVDTQGCELKANIKLDKVQFNTGTMVLSRESQSILEDIAQTLNNNQHLNFEIAGHTDSLGSYQSNVNLSQKRAEAVRDFLVNKGVAANRLTAKGYGPDKPAASNDTSEGRSKNRRVELIRK